jgi:hypothetical protein
VRQSGRHIAPLRDNTTRDKIGYYPPLPPNSSPLITTVRLHLDGDTARDDSVTASASYCPAHRLNSLKPITPQLRRNW